MTPASHVETPIAFEDHNHRRCAERVLAEVEGRCAERGLRLTPASAAGAGDPAREPRGARRLRRAGAAGRGGAGSQPPVAYRALDFLLEHGFAHKIQRMNAFVACLHPDAGHSPAFMICRVCRSVAETHAGRGRARSAAAARASGFTIERTVVEAEGVCPLCREAGPA